MRKLSSTSMKQLYHIPLVVTALLLAVSCGLARELHLLHYNDFHANNTPRYSVDETGNEYYHGGAAWLKGLLDSLRLVYEYDLLLNAGDDFQGNPISGITSGGSQITVMSAMGVDLFCPGNHEFDYGDLNLRRQLDMAQFEITCCNIADSAGGLTWPGFQVIELAGLRLGFIGVITAALPELVVKENLAHTRVLDPVESIRTQMEQLEEISDLQFLISHSGLYTDSLYAALVPGIEAIIGGHSHTVLPEGLQVGETLIVQAGCCGNWLGDLHIEIDDVTSVVRMSDHLHEVSRRSVSPSEAMLKTVGELDELLPPELNETIGQLVRPWIRRSGESNLGDWTADVMRDFAVTELAFMNLGGLRRDLPAGEITRLNIWEINPFGNHYVTFELSGLELLLFLRRVARGEVNESFAYSGMMFSIHRDLGAVSSILVNGESLVMNRTYTAVTNNFVFSHLEELFGLSPAAVNAIHLEQLDREVIIQAVLKQQTIEAVDQQRITFH
jgi:5'-nucleotidase / UDP-sugar diphosphatase